MDEITIKIMMTVVLVISVGAMVCGAYGIGKQHGMQKATNTFMPAFCKLLDANEIGLSKAVLDLKVTAEMLTNRIDATERIYKELKKENENGKHEEC